jgi:mannose-6-phosphate isomerase class I
MSESIRRRTSQEVLPVRKPRRPGAYDIYPSHPLGSAVLTGYAQLAAKLAPCRSALLDGYGGVFWDEVRQHLGDCFQEAGLSVTWLDVAHALKPAAEIEKLVAPSLPHDPVFGKRHPGSLRDFFAMEALAELEPDADADLTILYGSGAGLANWDACLVYFDVPKNEIQFRARAGSVVNLGAEVPGTPKEMYRRFYFVDWPVLNRHKRDLLPRIQWLVDSQRPGYPTFTSGDALHKGLNALARTSFRARPWFEPGAWGGQWIRDNIPGLNGDVPNYAWSFELISPENGLLFEHDGVLLEVSFDLLMYQESEAVLGRAWERFGEEFPIRFDFLDTVEGGNLSVQCHPRPEYIREQFGESFTQDETYYILDCAPEAKVYLGFTEAIDEARFRTELERSQRDGVAIDIDRYVNSERAHRHDLFLIPNGTVHSAGRGNLVLEISATPYIFTFKMYDWMRVDLDGKPRPINIERAFTNLDFSRKGEAVAAELISRPRVLERGEDWQLEQLPTHPEHFYEVRRITFASEVSLDTDLDCQVMSLVEGSSVLLLAGAGSAQRFCYAETFVVPAATGKYTLVNEGARPAMIVQAFVKAGS